MTYYLDRAELPTIPVPHDCVVERVSLSDGFLVLDFEQDISAHDSIQHIQPGANSLTIKIHLMDAFDIYLQKVRKFPTFKRSYLEIDFDRLARLVKGKRVEYLYHYVAYQSLIINLIQDTNMILDLRTDYIEYIWKLS